MNIKDNGNRIEKAIKLAYNLTDDEFGFDASLNGISVEIKGCMLIHKNGMSCNGREKTTKGRFWIERDSHRLLLDRRGLYIFAVYEMSGDVLIIRSTDVLSAKFINRMIGAGDNTKIRYDLIFNSMESLED